MKEVYNCKERFGYSMVYTRDIEVQNTFWAYCQGRSALWRKFFGFRKVEKDFEYYWLPTKIIDHLIFLSEYTGEEE